MRFLNQQNVTTRKKESTIFMEEEESLGNFVRFEKSTAAILSTRESIQRVIVVANS